MAWDETKQGIFDNLVEGHPEAHNDQFLEFLLDEAYFDRELAGETKEQIQDKLTDYLDETYGIDFDEAFDWPGWRAWYEGA